MEIPSTVNSSTRYRPRRKIIYAGIVLRRRRCLRYWLILPLLYILGLLICARPLSLFFFPVLPGSLYRSHEIFQKLRHRILADDSPALQLSSLWVYKKLKIEKPCKIANPATRMETSDNNGYLIVDANGGLNQQRSSICNAVAVAGFLNATLVIPRLEYHNVWQDSSHFDDIYDEQHFIDTLSSVVRVTREIPSNIMERFHYNISDVPIIQVPAWSPINYYLEEVYPILRNQGVVRIAPFANRLSMYVPPDIQYLRCLANYKSLKFASPVSTLAKKLIKRMMEKSPRTDGKYVSVHLRFEEDMVAFSCCIYDGGKKERFEMDYVREKGWKGKFRRRGTTINPGLNRVSGKCPMTPVEVGMMLRGMGFANDTIIYLASGKLYKEKRYLAPLLEMFPLLYTKESLATPEELAYFKGYSSRLAALDYVVCLFSDVFLTTQGGNFPHFLMGHRRYLYGGHAKTIKPNKQKLALLFHNTSISWEEIKDQVKVMLVESNREGLMMPRIKKSSRHNSIYKYPFPQCRCLQEAQNLTVNLANVGDLLDDKLKLII
ncbi:O-fucosyltransferase 10-like isoform X1 [Amaranthus tricolor]|uniref:O-fucosyltransferase 10-like isoform X1 n=1 Tax=Amaranthus tricolor TaxID=29722 RepID=UPI00258EE2CF|nr:O-fucosyltransferase 10-like isoform X1 [Amaranthus tricolor]